MEKIINLAKTLTDHFGPLNKNKITEPMLIRASAFSNLLQLTAKEKTLVQATVMYKRPSTLATMLTNYKKVAHSTTKNTGQGRSQPCKKCALCSHFNHYKSMVHQTSTITAANGKIFCIEANLGLLKLWHIHGYMLFMSQAIYWSNYKQIFKMLVPQQIYLKSI